MASKSRSRKAKGRRLQQWVAEKISILTGIDCGKDCDIESREMGQAGVDVKLYGVAKDMFPFSIECKNAESWKIHKWIEQAQDNTAPETEWLLVCKRNRRDPVIVMDADAFFKLYEKVLDYEESETSQQQGHQAD